MSALVIPFPWGAQPGRPIDRNASVVSGKIGAYFDIEKPKSAVASFVLTRAITSTIRTTAFDNPEMLKEQEFEDQLVRLANGFLQAQ